VPTEEDRRWCVYIHRNKINNKAYIGVAADAKKRWGIDGKNYLSQHTDGSYEHPAFARALMKYKDWNNDWEHIIFQENLTQAEAKHIEVLLIALFQTNCSRYKNPERGYNLTDGGDGVVGYVYTEEIKKKMRKPHPSIQGENHPNYGKTLSDETKNKIYESVKITMQNEDVLEKIRQPRPSMQGENNPNYGKSPQERMDEEAYKRWLENLRANILRGENHPLYGTHRESPMLGKRHTEETKEKMRGPRPSIQGENNPNYGRIYSDEEVLEIRKAHAKEMKCVVQLDVNGNLINKYESIRCANRETGIDRQCISFCCQDKYEKAGGFIWMYEYIYNQNINNIILYIQERKERIWQTRLVLSAI
jgi:group I intron endonuclease